jgi:hypothetical protein
MCLRQKVSCAVHKLTFKQNYLGRRTELAKLADGNNNYQIKTVSFSPGCVVHPQLERSYVGRVNCPILFSGKV